MRLLLMQHGANLPEDADPAKPLSPMGVHTVSKSARAARNMGLRVDLVLSSPKLRAVQTAEIMAEALDCGPDGLRQSPACNPLIRPEELRSLLLGFAPTRTSVLICGHLPQLPRLAALALDTRDSAVHFENAGLVQLDWPGLEPGAATLLWAMLSGQLARLS